MSKTNKVNFYNLTVLKLTRNLTKNTNKCSALQWMFTSLAITLKFQAYIILDWKEAVFKCLESGFDLNIHFSKES